MNTDCFYKRVSNKYQRLAQKVGLLTRLAVASAKADP